MSSEMVRILFVLDPEDWHGHSSEGLWAEPLSSAKPNGVYVVMNSPFFVRGISFLDVIQSAPSLDGTGRPVFSRVIEHRGHSTFRILVPLISSELEQYWLRIEAMGCTYESMIIDTSLGERILYSVDVPDSSDISAIYKVLKDGERNNVWIFEEGHLGHRLKD